MFPCLCPCGVLGLPVYWQLSGSARPPAQSSVKKADSPGTSQPQWSTPGALGWRGDARGFHGGSTLNHLMMMKYDWFHGNYTRPPNNDEILIYEDFTHCSLNTITTILQLILLNAFSRKKMINVVLTFSPYRSNSQWVSTGTGNGMMPNRPYLNQCWRRFMQPYVLLCINESRRNLKEITFSTAYLEWKS